VRVNLIRSISFSGKKILFTWKCKTSFFFLNIQKLYTLKKKNSLEQCKWIALCTRTQIWKSSQELLHQFYVQNVNWHGPHRSLNNIFDITKHNIWCDCFKRRSNHANNSLYSRRLDQAFSWPKPVSEDSLQALFLDNTCL